MNNQDQSKTEGGGAVASSDLLSGVLSESQLEAALRYMHEGIQRQRMAICEDEPPIDHEKHDLWKQLLDAEYYCIESAEELAGLSYVRESTPCPICRGSGTVALPPTYPPKRSEYTKSKCDHCKGAGRLKAA